MKRDGSAPAQLDAFGGFGVAYTPSAAVLEKWQAAKLAAPLQGATSSGRSVLLRVDPPTGGFYTTPRSQDIEYTADVYAFALWQIRVAQHVSTFGQ